MPTDIGIWGTDAHTSTSDIDESMADIGGLEDD